MTFAAPIFLALLVPWGVLALWLMWGRASATRVPFIELWRGSVAKPQASRQFRPPPLAIVAVLVAMLLAILAAARPVVRGGVREAGVTIVDRGITMSAGDRLAEALQRAPKTGETINVPDIQKSALDTREMLRRAVGSALARGDGRIVVVSDQPVQRDPRIVQIAPERDVENVGVVSFSIRERPTTQAMVAVRNDSGLAKAELVVDAVKQSIDLPPRGKTRNYFVDLTKAGATARAQLVVEDDLDADNIAWLARRRDWPRIEIASAAPAEVRRVVQAYQKARPGGESGARIVIGEDVLVASGNSRDAQAVTVTAHPITADADWSKVKLRPIEAAPPAGFVPIVSAGSSALVSVIEQPRRVHIAFESGDFARTSEFVVLWTHIFDWLGGGGGETFVSEPMNKLTEQWTPQNPGNVLQPGLYRRGDGVVAAFNAPAPVFPAPGAVDNAVPRAELSTEHENYNLLPWLALASIAMAALAAYAWPRQRLTPISAARTV